MVRVSYSEAKRFMIDCLKTVGAKTGPAKRQADFLLYADKTGHPSHGLSKLESCVYYIEGGLCLPNNKPVVLKEEKSTAWVDVRNGLGATAGHFAMNRAVNLANKTGVGWVTVSGCNQDTEPFSYWVKQAANKGFIGLVANAPLSLPCEQLQIQSAEPVYLRSGKNELVPISDVRIAEENQNIEEKNFQTPLSDIIPPECKKRGLQTILDLFRSCPGKDSQQSWSAEPLAKKLVHYFVAVNPTCFALGIDNRLAKINKVWKEWDEIDPRLPELLQGCEDTSLSEFENRSLKYTLQQINASLALAHKLGVKPMTLEDD